MSSRYGIVYSWKNGSSDRSGRYRPIRRVIVFSPAFGAAGGSRPSVHPRGGLPLRDLHREGLEPRPLRRPEGHRVVEEVRVVPLREVRPGLRAPRLLPAQGRGRAHLRELERPRELRVEERVLVPDAYLLEPSAQVPEDPRRGLEALAAPVDPDVLVHRVLHLLADARGALPALPLQEAVEAAGLLRLRHLRDRVRREARGLRERILRRVAGRPRTEHEAPAPGV